MPSSYDNDKALRSDGPSRAASLRAHEKENSLAPALVSQEAEATGSRATGSVSFRDGASRSRGSST